MSIETESEYRVEHLFLGPASTALYGKLRVPIESNEESIGVICCPPMGHEYFASYYALEDLARLCAVHGMSSLTFDFFGCGDSSGCFEDATIEQWLRDIQAAALFMRQNCGITKLFLIGLRLGATLSWLSNRNFPLTDGLILWDPIISGRDYLRELHQMHSAMVRMNGLSGGGRSISDYAEALGIPLSEQFKTELQELNLLEVDFEPTMVLLITTEVKQAVDELIHQLNRQTINVTAKSVEAPRVWLQDPANSCLPSVIGDEIVLWLRDMVQ